MANFFYRGKLQDSITQGTLNADSVSHAAQILERKGISILEIKEMVDKHVEYYTTNITQFTIKEKKEFFNSFYFQYKAGLSILEVLNIIASSATSENVKSIAYQISSKIKKGMSLDEAMRSYAKYIGYVYVVLMGAGEKTGKLDSVLEGIIKNVNLVEKIKTNVIKKMTYPVILICLAIAAALFFCFFVFEAFERQFDTTQDANLIPLFLTAAFKIAVIFAIGGVIVVSIIKNKKIMYSLLSFFTKISFLKPIFNNYYFYNFFHVLSLAYSAGLDTSKAVELSCEVINSSSIREKLKKSIDLISNGCELTTAFNIVGVFSQYAISQLSAGEKSGTISDLSETIASDYENNLNIQIDTLLKFVEPGMLVIVGFFVLLVMGKFVSTYYSKLFSLF
ncbi:type II secretion system F family protein [bacterium]|nr:type II secretion system F family protein [bacterium]